MKLFSSGGDSFQRQMEVTFSHISINVHANSLVIYVVVFMSCTFSERRQKRKPGSTNTISQIQMYAIIPSAMHTFPFP